MAILLSSALIFVSCLFTSQINNYEKDEIVVLETKTCNIEGTLTVPDIPEKMPVVLIIAGSGPTDRDGNNPGAQTNSYKYIAESLAKNGIASLRYDKRAIAKSSNGDINEANLRFETYINDAEEWVEFLKKDSRFSKIIVLGHSQGSLIGMIISQRENVDEFISIEGAGRSIDLVLKEQLKAQLGNSFIYAEPIIDSLANGKLVENVAPGFYSIFRESIQPYLISWMKFDPCKEIQKLNKPILIIQGTTDLQVKIEDANLLKEVTPNSELKIIEGMNHIMKDAEADRMKNMETYYKPELPLNEELVSSIINFIKK